MIDLDFGFFVRRYTCCVGCGGRRRLGRLYWARYFVSLAELKLDLLYGDVGMERARKVISRKLLEFFDLDRFADGTVTVAVLDGCLAFQPLEVVVSSSLGTPDVGGVTESAHFGSYSDRNCS